jgi:hypothetical protein
MRCRLFAVALLCTFAASCGRSDLGFDDGRSPRQPGLTDTSIRPDAGDIDEDAEDVDAEDMTDTDVAIEVCDNGVDDDFDGAVDCNDGDCAADPACAVANCPQYEIPGLVSTDEPVLTVEFGPASGLAQDCLNDRAGESTVLWSAPFSGTFRFFVDGGDRVEVGVLSGTCGGEALACGVGVATLDFTEGDSVVLVLPGQPGNGADLFITGEPTIEICNDGIDNDDDGDTDCNDEDCNVSPFCPRIAERDCQDLLDNDRDGLTDCDDPDCAVTPACEEPEFEFDCFDDRDNDFDTLIDCEDPDCFEQCSPRVELDCFDGADNDFDGLVDCFDPDCADDEACVGFEICDNDIDDDRDGRIDCDDFDCAAFPGCSSRVEDCSNGLDDDQDGRIDCADFDCFDDVACITPPECPGDDLGSALGNIASGDTTGASNDLSGFCGGGGAPERTFSWRAPSDGTFRFTTEGSTLDTVLYLRLDGCEGPEFACDDNGLGRQSNILADLAEGSEVIIVVDGAGRLSGAFGLSVLSVDASDEFGRCDDGIDNDGDGRTDCADEDCLGDTACFDTEICFDGIDNDDDGAIDCRDTDCAGDINCLRPENCENGLDDDGDTLVDCGDPDCFGVEVCAAPEVCDNGIDDDLDGSADCLDEDCFDDPDCRFGDEICFDGIDNDGDARIDCDDPDCFGSPFCFEAEICFDGADNDGDGLIDCVDPDCFFTPFCPEPVELCSNGRDDDADGLIDCEDSDCLGAPECGDVCPSGDLGRSIGIFVAAGNTSGGTDSSQGSCGGGDAPETSFSWRAPADGVYAVDTLGSAFDTVLYARARSCDGDEVLCDDDTGGAQSRIELVASRNQRFVIFVDGFRSNAGFFQLNITSLTPDSEFGLCSDDEDNDGDGRTDCDDPDCFGDATCEEPIENCANGRDDDGDGLVDCRDPDCEFDPFCGATPEDCANGRDDDGDGAVDCDDRDCAESPSCFQVEICDNGFDDDRNGLIDCADFACFDDPNCRVPVPEICDNGEDDDLDGRIDCADVDCTLDPSCFFSENCTNGRDDDGDGLIDCADPSCIFEPSCNGENCSNGIDDDGDGAIDCEDVECIIEPECAGSEDCFNGIDDDGDGAIDCDDLNCVLEPSCRIPENCGNRFDDDDDGDIDCDDSECADSPLCAVADCPNGDLGSAVGPSVAAGSTRGASNEVSGTCGGDSAEDVGFTWRAPRTGRYVFDTNGSSYDSLLVILDGSSCDGAELACDDDLGEFNAARVELLLRRNARITIVVAGFAANSGDFVLNITELLSSEAGLCSDGEDNDGDGVFDCGDADCFGDPFCAPPVEVCDNGIDDDDDGSADCSDPDCADDIFCAPPTEICDNGVDDDRDGATDCDDSDCADAPECELACPTGDLGSAVGDRVVEVSTSGGTSDSRGTCGGSGPERTFSWTAPDRGRWLFDTNGSTFDSVLYIRDGSCGGNELSCNDDDGDGSNAELVLDVDEGQTVVLFVDSFFSGGGDAVLNINQVPNRETGLCDDGEDNDLDGAVDCDDRDCRLDDACVVPEICGNGADDDGDGAVDCDDSDCEGSPLCPTTEICNNGIDDDRDGRTDCEDADCADDPSCLLPELCGNGIDDDDDGDVDCDDSDCADAPECAFVCPDRDLGSRVGERVATGNTIGAGDDFNGSCAGGSGEDLAFSWRAPRNGRYVFDTFGSEYDTQLHIRLGGCEGDEVVCDDDTGGQQSEVFLPLVAGTQIVIMVDGFSATSRGQFQLNIAQVLTSEAGLCGDGVDNDSDGDTDCDDEDCFDEEECFTPEVCFNGEDDDRDGDIDCDDDDCDGFPTCGTDEICNNGVDDDLDGATDCEDPDCEDSPSCRICPDESIGSTTGDAVFFADFFDQDDDAGSCGVEGGEDVSVSWTAPAAGRYLVSTRGSFGFFAFYVRSGSCDGRELDCQFNDSGAPAETILSARRGQAFVFFFDSSEPIEAFGQLSITPLSPDEAGLCFDGIDNDGDGPVDCDDEDCVDDEFCVVSEVCSNGFDDDGDGEVDCDDDDCAGTPECFTETERCENGFDDDGDGAVDCDDAECLLDNACRTSEDCSNGVDDDGDGRVDCADNTCSLDPACFAAEQCFNGSDDDGDGLIDCDDPSCAARPRCFGANTEECGNGIDDDDDGLIDCDDPGCVFSFDCFSFP